MWALVLWSVSWNAGGRRNKEESRGSYNLLATLNFCDHISMSTSHGGASEPLIIKGPLSFYVVTKGPLPGLLCSLTDRKAFLVISDRIFHLML